MAFPNTGALGLPGHANQPLPVYFCSSCARLEVSNETRVLALFVAAQQQTLGQARAADGHRKESHELVLAAGARHGGIGKEIGDSMVLPSPDLVTPP